MALVPCILYRISTDQIIDYDCELNSDYLPPSGLDPDLEYYAKYEPFPEPEYDPRGWRLIVTSVRVESSHPTWPALDKYETTYSLDRRTDEELKASVDTMQAWADEQLCPINHASNETRVKKIYHKKIKGLPTEQWEEDLVDAVDNIASKMDDNSDNKDIMYDYIDANPTLVPDFDDGWTIS